MAGLFTSTPVTILSSTQTSPTAMKQLAAQIGSNAQKAIDPDMQQMYTMLGQAVSSLNNSLNPIVTALRNPVPLPQTIAITDPNGNLIAWLGYATANGKSYSGAWFKQLYVGGADPSTAKLIADANGNLTITDATITLTGSDATIVLDPNTGDISVTGALSSIETVISSGGVTVQLLPQPGNELSQIGAGTIVVVNGGGIDQVQLSALGSGAGVNIGAASSYQVQHNVVIDSGQHAFFNNLTINGTLAIDNNRNANLLSLTINTSWVIASSGDALFNQVAVPSGIVISPTGVVSSSNGFTGSATFIETISINFTAQTWVTTGATISVVNGIVTSII